MRHPDRAGARRLTTARTGVASREREVIRKLDARLARAYRTPERELGNLEDPLAEAIYMVLSAQTDVPRAREAWRALRAAFPAWNDLERASPRVIATVLQPAGLHRQKARTLRQLLREVRRRYGVLSLDELKALGDAALEAALLQLPGMSWKSARCVMLYAFGRRVFPVDVNTFRILKRVGLLDEAQVYRRKGLHDALQALVPAPVRRRFHINLVVHGQRTCRPASPRCPGCPVRLICKMGRLSRSSARRGHRHHE